MSQSIVDQKTLTTSPKVSIIIPTHNRKALLGEAVRSCLDQTWPNVEVIIVDDGSTDGTEVFVAELLAGPWAGRVQYHRQENAGASAARNKGLEFAQGEYIQFLDSDDLLYKDKIARQVAQFEKDDSMPEGCSCFGRYGRMPQDLNATKLIGVRCSTPQDYMRRLCSGEVLVMGTPAPLWRRSFLSGRPGWRSDISHGDDLEYHLRLLADAKTMAFVEEDLYFVREHDGGRLSDSIKQYPRMQSAIQTHRIVVETIRKAGLWDASMQKGILRVARTLYSNILECGTVEDIRDYEDWVLGLVRESEYKSHLAALIYCRRLLGGRFLLMAHRIISGVRAV